MVDDFNHLTTTLQLWKDYFWSTGVGAGVPSLQSPFGQACRVRVEVCNVVFLSIKWVPLYKHKGGEVLFVLINNVTSTKGQMTELNNFVGVF